jgi:hypothetical protein
MTTARRSGVALALLGAQLAACTPSTWSSSPEISQSSGNFGVEVREDLSRRFIALIGPQVQIAPPYLGIPNTNIARLRSFFDRKTGDTAHQLYVIASYEGNHDWSAAHDGAGQALQFIPISRLQIACERPDKCSYAEEFAAKFPASELSNNTGGFAITFTDRTGNAQTVPVSAAQVAAQLTALTDVHKQMAAMSVTTAAGHPAQKP